MQGLQGVIIKMKRGTGVAGVANVAGVAEVTGVVEIVGSVGVIGGLQEL